MFIVGDINKEMNFYSSSDLPSMSSTFLENCQKFSRIFTSRSRSRTILISLFTSRKRVKAFFFTLHFSKKSESIFFSLCTSRKRVKASFFHFSLLELPRPTLAGACHVNADVLRFPKIWYF